MRKISGSSPIPAIGYARRLLSRPWVLAITIAACAATIACAEDGTWEAFPLPGNGKIVRGPGFYFSPIKLGILWILFLIWVKSVDWTSRDCLTHRFDYSKWVPIVAGPFVAGLLFGALLIPLFWLGAPIALISIAAPLVVYILMRNEEVEPHEQVFTKSHLRFLMSEAVNKMGGKMAAEAQAEHEKGAQVEFLPFGGGKDQDAQANLIRARQNPGYVNCKQMVADAVEARAEKVMCDINAASLTMRHQIDGVWHEAEGMEREEGDELISALKLIASMNPKDRKSRQSGRIGIKFEGTKYFCAIVSQGTKTGERIITTLSGKASKYQKLDDLGMREAVIKQLKEKMLQENGILLFTALPGGGLTTTFTASINSTDRLLRDFVSLEPHDDKMPEVENCDPVYIEEGETIAGKLPAILRKDADVIAVPNLPEKESVTALCKSAQDRLLFMAVPAKDSMEAMLRVLMTKVSIKDFASVISVVVSQRMIRKLCEDCKEGYKPSAAQLQKLRLPAKRVGEFYKPPVLGPEDKEICPTCNGIGYFGRTAIFEYVEVKENLRKALVTQPKLDVLRKASRADKNRTLQEEGILAVVQGITSLAEIQRALKQ